MESLGGEAICSVETFEELARFSVVLLRQEKKLLPPAEDPVDLDLEVRR
jgi:hypothetical protein